MPTAVAIRQIPGKPGSVYYPLTHIPLTLPSLGPEDIEVSLHAAALNHRDLFIRQHLYPGTTFQVPLLADGYGTVVATGSSPSAQRWQGKRVVLNPGRGWKDDTEGPEGSYAILGGTKFWPSGTLAERIVLPAGEVEEAPGHLSAVEAAALPLTGLTAWRALVTKSRAAREGSTILVTGIGGGVALMVLGFAAAMGAKVFVTSGSEEKLRKAKDLGAQGGVSYKDEKWDGKLKGLLPEGSKGFDAVIDGAGGDVVDRAVKLLRVSRENLCLCHSTGVLTCLSAWRCDRLLWYDAWSEGFIQHGSSVEEY